VRVGGIVSDFGGGVLLFEIGSRVGGRSPASHLPIARSGPGLGLAMPEDRRPRIKWPNLPIQRMQRRGAGARQ